MKPGSAKSTRPKLSGNKAKKKVLGKPKSNGMKLLTTYPQLNEDIHDDSSYRSLSSSFSGYSSLMNGYEHKRSEEAQSSRVMEESSTNHLIDV